MSINSQCEESLQNGYLWVDCREVQWVTLAYLDTESLFRYAVVCKSYADLMYRYGDLVWKQLFMNRWGDWLVRWKPPSQSWRQLCLSLGNHHSPRLYAIGTMLREEEQYGRDDIQTIYSTLSTHDKRPANSSESPVSWKNFFLRTPNNRCASTTCRDFQSNIYLIGGYQMESGSCCSVVEKFDYKAHSWKQCTEIASLNTARACSSAVIISNGYEMDEKILVAGGGTSMFADAGVFQTVEVCSLSDDEPVFSYGPDLQIPRCALSIVNHIATNRVYAIGGYAGNKRYLNTTEFLQIDSDRGWLPGPPMASCRAGVVATVGPDKCIYALGGGFSGHENLNTVERLDVREGIWRTDVPPMTRTRRCFVGGFAADGNLYVGGGWDPKEWALVNVEMLDLRMLKWQCLPPLNFPMQFCTGGVIF